MIRFRYQGNGCGWVYANARSEDEAQRMMQALRSQGYTVERL